MTYGQGKCIQALYSEILAFSHGTMSLEHTEQVLVKLAEDEPASYTEAIKSPDADEWKKACQAEYENLMSYNTWSLVKRPTHINIVGNRWVFQVKRDNLGTLDRRKAQLVAQGFSQVPGVENLRNLV